MVSVFVGFGESWRSVFYGQLEFYREGGIIPNIGAEAKGRVVCEVLGPDGIWNPERVVCCDRNRFQKGQCGDRSPIRLGRRGCRHAVEWVRGSISDYIQEHPGQKHVLTIETGSADEETYTGEVYFANKTVHSIVIARGHIRHSSQ